MRFIRMHFEGARNFSIKAENCGRLERLDFDTAVHGVVFDEMRVFDFLVE